NGQGGIQVDNLEALALPDLISSTVGPTESTFYQFDVLPSLQAWAANPGSNLGWAIRPPGTDNGVVFASSESSTAANRPKLTVTYAPPPPLPPVAVDDSVVTDRNTAAIIAVLNNDYDPNGDTML